MRSLFSVITAVILTFSGLCSSMAVFAMEDRQTNAPVHHATEWMPVKETHHDQVALPSTSPRMACCESKRQTESAIPREQTSAIDLPCATLANDKDALEAVDDPTHLPSVTKRPPDDFERTSLPKRE